MKTEMSVPRIWYYDSDEDVMYTSKEEFEKEQPEDKNYWSECIEFVELSYSQELEKQVAELKAEIQTAVKYLSEGKAKFTPNTTNSFVDAFIERWGDK